MHYRAVAEWELSEPERTQIAELLDVCFPETFEGRTYYKQLASLRVLALHEQRLVGHLALDHRVIRVGSDVVPILGIVDLAVDPNERRKGVGAELLHRAEVIAQQAGCAFLVAMADRHDLYLRCEYRRLAAAETRFLAIDERRSHSLISRPLDDIFLVKALNDTRWPSGEIDLLGHLF